MDMKKYKKIFSFPTFVVEESLHLHGWPGVSDTEHGAGYNALLSWRAVCGPHQTPIRFVMESLQNLHCLASAHRQLPTATITGHKVMDHYSQLTTTGQLKWNEEGIHVSKNLMMVYYKEISFYSAGHVFAQSPCHSGRLLRWIYILKNH